MKKLYCLLGISLVSVTFLSSGLGLNSNVYAEVNTSGESLAQANTTVEELQAVIDAAKPFIDYDKYDKVAVDTLKLYIEFAESDIANGYATDITIPDSIDSIQSAVEIVKKSAINSNSSFKPVYRVYNSNNGDHLYTTSTSEYDWLASIKWTTEGIAFQSVLSDYEGAVPVYRLYNPNSGEHFYTTSEDEYNSVSEAGWSKEQVGFYMAPKDTGDAVYRVFNPNATGPGSHFYTSNKTEADGLVNKGWKDEGIAFYSAK